MLHLRVFSKFRDFWEHFLKLNNAVFNGEQEKESIIRLRIGSKNPSHVITVSHHWPSLVMPIGDLWDRFFYSTLTLMIDSYDCISIHVYLVDILW